MYWILFLFSFLPHFHLRQSRSVEDMKDSKRGLLNERYADEMLRLAEKYFEDNWVLFFAADAQMNTSPWNYWKESLPQGQGKTFQPRMDKVAFFLDTILERDPFNAAALHMTIHLYESAKDPSKAIDASNRLEKLHISGSEHLLHMPSHGFIRSGEYKRAAKANEMSKKVDLSEHSYPLHNIEMLVYALTSAGDAKGVAENSWYLHGLAVDSLRHAEGYEAIFPFERFSVAPIYSSVCFGNYTFLESLKEPAANRVIERIYYHFGKGAFWVESSDEQKAKKSLSEMSMAIDELDATDNVKRYFASLYPIQKITNIVKLYLESKIGG